MTSFQRKFTVSDLFQQARSDTLKVQFIGQYLVVSSGWTSLREKSGSSVYIAKGGSFVVSIKYKIHRLSARAVMGYAKETAQGIYSFHLNNPATEKCRASAQVEQNDNALFY